jgi:phage tail protein X
MRLGLIILIFLTILSACASPAPGNTQTASTPAPAELTPYQTLLPTPTATLIPPLTTPKLPTTTPIIYTIKAGDTLSAIAARYHVPVEALLAANPGIQAGALVVGKTLVIPTGIQATGVALPTPAAVPVTQAQCYPEAAGGLWCFALLQNAYAETLENLSVQFTLLDSTGQELASQIAYGLLDILPAGRTMPLAAYFPPPAPAGAQVRAQVLTALRLISGEGRYMDAAIENTLVEMDSTGRTASVSGQVVIHGDQVPAGLWVLAAAYDRDGNVVGLRRWEPDQVPTGEEPVRFEFQVSSAGPAIDRVEFLAEVKVK